MTKKKVKAKKHLGQHFLIDESITKNIATAIACHNDCKAVIEVGPGTGVLTKYLIEEDFNFTAVEIDRESIEYLAINYPNLKVVTEDFLKLNLNDYTIDNKLAVIGNFPYYISTQILFKAYENKEIVTEVVGMFQKEVAERIAEPPGSKKYGILSVLLQAFYDIEYLFTVNENAFNPPPKVKSGVIRLKRNNVKTLPCDLKLFKQVVKAGFNQRRKTLRNSLKALLTDEIRSNEIFTKRPEQLGVYDFVAICKLIEQTK